MFALLAFPCTGLVLCCIRVCLAYSTHGTADETRFHPCDSAVVRYTAYASLVAGECNSKLASGMIPTALLWCWSLCRMGLSMELPGGMLQAAGHTGEHDTCLGEQHHDKTLVLIWFLTQGFSLAKFPSYHLVGHPATWHVLLMHGVSHHNLLMSPKEGSLPRDIFKNKQKQKQKKHFKIFTRFLQTSSHFLYSSPQKQTNK